MWFRHLDYRPGTPVTDLGPAGIDALLERGDLEAWAPLLRTIACDPWSATADTVLRLCDAHPMYGTSALWRTWIERRRGRSGEEGATLAQARARAGLTQSQVTERLGISQADVSKLERRADIRLSTLRAYARAIGARLHLGCRGRMTALPGRWCFRSPSGRNVANGGRRNRKARTPRSGVPIAGQRPRVLANHWKASRTISSGVPWPPANSW